jgi:hypothetical protein
VKRDCKINHYPQILKSAQICEICINQRNSEQQHII